MEPRVWHQHYDAEVPPSLAFEPLTVPLLLERAATEHGAATAVIFLNCRLDYRELQREVARFGTALAHLRVSKDSRVAIQLPNLPQTVIA